MRAYLSSQGFGAHTERLLAMMGENRKVLFVDNAKDDSDEAERAAHVAEKKQEFEALGLEFYELDLRRYVGKAEQLRAIVNETGLLWLSGGNTFVLRRALYASGLDAIIEDGMRQDLFVYGGSSAGAIVMTKTLRGTENGDDPYTVPDGYEQEIIWQGMGLVYPQLVPHYQSEWFGTEAQAMVDYFEHNGLRYETLRDGDVYIIDGEYEEKLVA